MCSLDQKGIIGMTRLESLTKRNQSSIDNDRKEYKQSQIMDYRGVCRPHRSVRAQREEYICIGESGSKGKIGVCQSAHGKEEPRMIFMSCWLVIMFEKVKYT